MAHGPNQAVFGLGRPSDKSGLQDENEDNDLAGVLGDDANDGAVDAGTLADDAVDSAEIADGAVDAVHLSANSVDSDAYVDGSIDAAHLSANSLDSAAYVDASIDPEHLAPTTRAFHDGIAGDVSITEDATPASTGLVLTGLAAAAETHLIRAVVYVTATTNGGIELSFTAPANATFVWRAKVFQAADNVLTFPDGAPGAVGTALNYITAALAEDVIEIEGILTNVDTAGSFTILAAQDTSHVDATVVHAESFLVATRVG